MNQHLGAARDGRDQALRLTLLPPTLLPATHAGDVKRPV